jgi:small subunit ribosomal protein S16
VAVKIKLKRMGKIHAPYYRIIVADARTKRDGRAIEEIGKYHPKAEPSFIEVDSARAQHWLSVGAQPTDPVRKILEITGDWQKFKGLPGAEGTLRVAEPKASKKDLFASVVAETLGAGAASQKGKAAGGAKADQAKAGSGRSGKPAAGAKAEAKADTAKADAKADTAKADTAKADAKADTAKADTAKAGEAKADAGAAEAAAESDAGA